MKLQFLKKLFRSASKRPLPEKPKVQEQETITLSSDDDCFTRAKKILFAAGIVDRLGVSSRMAEVVEAYRRLDLKAAVLELESASGAGCPEPKENE